MLVKSFFARQTKKHRIRFFNKHRATPVRNVSKLSLELHEASRTPTPSLLNASGMDIMGLIDSVEDRPDTLSLANFLRSTPNAGAFYPAKDAIAALS